MGRSLRAMILLATTMALLMLALTSSYQKVTEMDAHNDEEVAVISPKRVSRFLSQTTKQQQQHMHMHMHGRSLRPADHCHKDYEVCRIEYGVNSTCCGNKCFDITTDKHNCGACHNKCKFTNTCCNGKCVDLAYDKRNCGSCNNKCLTGQYCVYGMCDYA